MTEAWRPFHPYVAVIVCAIFSQLLFFSSAWEHWRLRWKVTSEVSQLVPSIKTSCSATKSCQVPPPCCLPQNPVSVCLPLSPSHPSSLPRNSDAYPADRVGGQGTRASFRYIYLSTTSSMATGWCCQCHLSICLSVLPEGELSPSAVEMSLQSLWQVPVGIWPSSWADERFLFALENVITFFYQQAEGIRP